MSVLRKAEACKGEVKPRRASQKDQLKSMGVRNRVERIGEWRKLLLSIVEMEGSYSAPVGGPIPKNETMMMLEDMAVYGNKKERIEACVGFGEMRLNFPEMSAWADEALLLLGTDGDTDVRRQAVLALNMVKSRTQLFLEQLGELEKKEKKKKSNP